MMTFRRHFALSLCAALVACSCAGCGVKRPPAESTGASVSRVAVVRPQRKTIRRVSIQPGQIEAFDEARVFAKIPAYVEKYHVDIGDEVQGPRYDASGDRTERGQLMAELFAPELNRELQQKKAAVVQAGADVEQAQAAVKVAEANARAADAQLDEAVAATERFEGEFERWNSEYKRVAQLVSRSVVNQKVADETKAQLSAADAARKEAQAKVQSARSAAAASAAQVEKAQADEAAIRARRQVAEADHDRTLALVDYLRIEAPFDGIVSQRKADIGYFADSGGGNQAQPLFTVVRVDPVRVFVDLPEMDAPLAEVGDQATIRVQALAGRDFPGKVTRTAWALDSMTRTLHTEVDVPNADRVLRPGMYAQVSIELANSADALVVPASAVVTQGGQSWCFAIDNGKAIRKVVTLGIKSGGEVEIISGLNGDELLAKDRAASLSDGQAVEVSEPASGK